MTEYIASSAAVGRRPRMSRMRWYSSGLRPSSAYGWTSSGVAAACSTVSSAGRAEAWDAGAVIGSLGWALSGERTTAHDQSTGVTARPGRASRPGGTRGGARRSTPARSGGQPDDDGEHPERGRHELD